MAPSVATPGLCSSVLSSHVNAASHLRCAGHRFCSTHPSSVFSRRCNAPSPTRPTSFNRNVIIRAAASVEAPAQDADVYVSIDNTQDSTFTVVTISGYNKPGLLTSISGTFRDLGLDVGKVSLSGRLLWASTTNHVLYACSQRCHCWIPRQSVFFIILHKVKHISPL